MTKDKHLWTAASGLAIAAALAACTPTTGIEGEWTAPVPGMEHLSQGFSLQPGGKASSIGMATLQYETWQREGDRLILSGKSLGNGRTIPATDTFVVEKLTPDSLVVRKKQLTLRFARKADGQTDGQAPSPQATATGEQRFLTKGTLVLAHETRSFTPAGDSLARWVVDKTGRLAQEYDKLTGGIKNGTPVYAELEVVDAGKTDEGFGEDLHERLSGSRHQRAVSIRKIEPRGCRVRPEEERPCRHTCALPGARLCPPAGTGVPAREQR